MAPLRYISTADVKRVLTAEVAVRLAESALADIAAGRTTWSTPRVMRIAPAGTSRRYMAKACVLDERTAGFRVGSVDREQAEVQASEGPPSLLTLLCDPASGRFLAVIDEEWQHAVRTGAAAALAARYAAPPGRQVVAVIGAGRVSGPTIEALRVVFDEPEIRLSSRRAESREALAASLGGGVKPLPVDQALDGATVVITATTAKQPIVTAEALGAGTFVYAMGDGQELSDDAYRRADVVMADDWEQVATRQDIARLVEEGVIHADSVVSLWEVVAGIRPGRLHASDIVLMRSQGLVVQDVAIARYVYDECTRAGLGTVIGARAEA